MVVKVQRPGIRPVVERDLDIVTGWPGRSAATTSWGRSIGVRDLAGGFAVALREELDFRVEAANMAAVARPTPAGHASGSRGRTGRWCTERCW